MPEKSTAPSGPCLGMATDKVIALSSDQSPQQNLHLHLESVDIAGTFNSLLHSLQRKLKLCIQVLLPRSQTRGTDTAQPESPAKRKASRVSFSNRAAFADFFCAGKKSPRKKELSFSRSFSTV